MTFEQFAAIVRDWMNRLTPAQARSSAESLRRQVYISDLPDEIPLDAVLAAITRAGPAPVLDGVATGVFNIPVAEAASGCRPS